MPPGYATLRQPTNWHAHCQVATTFRRWHSVGYRRRRPIIRPGRQHMANPPIRFNDGGAYERGMGGWSRLVGEVFLDWLAPPSGARWIDVGCGSGAFTELLMQRCAPAEVHGIDPSDA